MWTRALLILLAGALTYANSLSGPFVLDDQDTIVMNEQIRQLSPSVVLFPARELPVAGRPVVNLSLGLNYAAGGLDVWGYHAVNVALHLMCALLLFGIVRRTLLLPILRDRFGDRSTDLAFAAALIWTVHPLQTDAVDYLTQRTELLMGFFYLLALYASIRARQQPVPARQTPRTGRRDTSDAAPAATSREEDARWRLLAVMSCALGMASKESMVTAPFLILVYDRVFLFGSLKEAWHSRGRHYVALAATWIVLAGLVSTGPRFRSAGFSAGVSVWTYLLNQAEMIVRYLRLAIWPSALVVDYGTPRALGVRDVWPQAALIAALAGSTLWALVRTPPIGFLGVWVFTTLAPTSSFVPIATEVGAERRMYLPLAALVVLAVVAVAWMLERLAAAGMPRRLAHAAGLIALAGVALALSLATIERNREYASAVTLARVNLERWPTPRGRHSLGTALIADRRYAEGIGVLREAVLEDPAAHYTLGVALFQQGRLEEAVAQLGQFLAAESERLEVPMAHELIGRALKSQGRFTEADVHFRQVLAMVPSKVEVHGLLAESLFRQERYGEAIPHYERFLDRRRGEVGSLVQSGIAYAAVGRHDAAVARFREVVALVPGDAGARLNLAQALLDNGNVDGGIAEMRRALELDPGNTQIRAQLEAALRQKADPDRGP